MAVAVTRRVAKKGAAPLCKAGPKPRAARRQDRAGGRRSCEACEHGEELSAGVVPSVSRRADRVLICTHAQPRHIRLAYPGRC
jgi:hypothetical protein